MTEPVGNRSNQGQQLDAVLRAVAGTDEGVSARHAPARHETESAPRVAVRETAIHGGAMLAEHGAALGGYTTAATTVSIGTYVLTPLFALGHVVTDADERGASMRAGMHHDRMRGALAALEGRADNPEARAEMARNPNYADGVHRVENLARTMSTRDFGTLVQFVRQANSEGTAAVCLGRDHGAAFQQRYDSDAAFAHGVDYARRLETSDPDAFAARSARLADLEAEHQAARQRAPIRP